ncbi:helix-turn-helix transcriptional regulator [Cryobacterium cryoconiti]|uniref:Transcriptional regulator n=1 Tax=Cryobacterium cryoconiti TaxID=1259239 RepID=A0A4Y8K031_9MICO|nr:helix-turn-helix transcriptional regulator [Cryobacterium cryoconiti]TFD33214.1 transcriptional regulator [Cryobacterium cryoconiti]
MTKPTRVSNRIADLRARAGEMSQRELATRIGVTRQTVNAIELEKYSPSLEVAFKIARVFDVGLEDVFHYPSGAAAALPPAGGVS